MDSITQKTTCGKYKLELNLTFFVITVVNNAQPTDAVHIPLPCIFIELEDLTGIVK